MSKAADELFISQPAVSQSIKKLETQLNGTLFIRSNKGLKLTEEGAMFYNHIKQAVESISNAENQFTYYKNLEIGQLKIGASTTLTELVLLDSLEAFTSLFPNITIDITNDLTSNLITMLNNGLLDLVILNEDEKDHDNLILVPIKDIDHCFICNKKYADLSKKVVSLNELNNYPLLLQKKGSNTRQYLDSFALEHKVILIPSMEVVSQDLIMQFTKIGLGIGFTIKDFVTEELLNKELLEIKTKEQMEQKKIWLATSKNTIPTFAAKKFAQIIIKNNKVE